MQIEYDPEKRDATLRVRGLDMADAAEAFTNVIVSFEDIRQDYDETRFITVGYMADRMVVLVWTWRYTARRIISLRKANAREQATFAPPL